MCPYRSFHIWERKKKPWSSWSIRRSTTGKKTPNKIKQQYPWPSKNAVETITRTIMELKDQLIAGFRNVLRRFVENQEYFPMRNELWLQGIQRLDVAKTRWKEWEKITYGTNGPIPVSSQHMSYCPFHLPSRPVICRQVKVMRSGNWSVYAKICCFFSTGFPLKMK